MPTKYNLGFVCVAPGHIGKSDATVGCAHLIFQGPRIPMKPPGSCMTRLRTPSREPKPKGPTDKRGRSISHTRGGLMQRPVALR